MDIKIETSTHIVSVCEGYIFIEDKEDEYGEPIIKEIGELDILYKASIQSLYPIIDWLIKEIGVRPKRKYNKRKKNES
jgi:DNA-binding PadR family transcriptional regulator